MPNLLAPSFEVYDSTSFLVSVADFKAYMKIEHTAEDGLISQILLRAHALVETYLGRAIVGSDGRTFAASGGGFTVVTSFRNSAADTTVASFARAQAVSLDSLPDYASRIRFVIAAAIIDVAADIYARRVTTISSESAGGGVSVSYTADGIPIRVARMLRSFRAAGLQT